MNVELKRKLSSPWGEAVKVIPKLSEKECKDALLLLKKEAKDGKRNVKDLTHRVYRRLNKLRAERERQELQI